MGTFLLILVLASALFAFITGVIALRAWLRFRLSRAALISHLSREAARLAGRTAELEESVNALDTRAQALPVHISELQQNLAALRVLTGVLGTSVGQIQRLLSFRGLRSFLS